MHSFIPFIHTFHHVDMVLAPWMLTTHLGDTGESYGENLFSD